MELLFNDEELYIDELVNRQYYNEIYDNLKLKKNNKRINNIKELLKIKNKINKIKKKLIF